MVRRLDHPLTPALIALAAFGLFVAARLASFEGDASRFIGAGANHVDVSRAPTGLHVQPDDGYDGQYFYRLALAPLRFAPESHGVALDLGPYRQQRIAFPVLAWVASTGGDPDRLPTAFLAVNLAAVFAVGWAGGALARDAGRHALAGLALAAYPGFVLSISRTLAEVVAAAFLAAGLLALRRRRPTLAGVLLAGSVLAKETTVLAVVALGVVLLADRVGPRRLPPRLWSAVLVPAAALAGWQALLWERWGQLAADAGQGNVGRPFAALVDYARGAVPPASGVEWLELGELAWLGLLAAAVVLSLRSSRAPAWEKLGAGLAIVLAVSLTELVWVQDWAFMRALTELHVLGVAVLLARPGPVLPVVAAPAAGLTVSSAALRASGF